MPGLTHETLHEEMRCIQRKMLAMSIHLESCMEAQDLIDFEVAHALRFPADYRLYLLQIGNGVGIGGAACSEGILELGRTPFAYPLDFSDLAKTLHQPFPYQDARIVVAETATDVEGITTITSTMRTVHRRNLTYSHDMSSQYDQEAAALLRLVQARHRNVGGYITLGTSLNSHDHFWILICEGSCRGEVWIVTWHGNFYPCTPRMTFKDWLLDWIDGSGWKIERSLSNTHGYPNTSTALDHSTSTSSEEEEEEEEEYIQEEEEEQQQQQQQLAQPEPQDIQAPVYRSHMLARRGATVSFQSMR
ncbi:hypothetical protein MBANPS3_003384 [Mucor bainieri]